MSAAQEAEAGESLEPGRWRLQLAEIVPLHSSLGVRPGEKLSSYLNRCRKSKVFEKITDINKTFGQIRIV